MENGLENRMDNGMEKKIAMVHGSGGSATAELIAEVFAKEFDNDILNQMEDSAWCRCPDSIGRNYGQFCGNAGGVSPEGISAGWRSVEQSTIFWPGGSAEISDLWLYPSGGSPPGTASENRTFHGPYRQGKRVVADRGREIPR